MNRPTARRTAAGFAAATFAAVVLSGCGTDVTTRIEVNSATSTQITAVVTFTDEIAANLADHPQTESELLKVFESRTGGKRPDRTGDRRRRTYTVPVTFEQLKNSSDVLGISDASLSATNDKTTLTLTMATPKKLVEAIVSQTATQPDSTVLAETMARNTQVTIEAVFPGGVTGTTSPNAAAKTVRVAGDTAKIEQTVATFVDGTYTVTGDPTLSWTQKIKRAVLSLPGLLVIGALVVGGVGGVVLRRRGIIPTRRR